jgi:hypothetical protein
MGHGGDEEGTTEEWRGVTGPGRRGQARSTGHDPFPLRSKARRPFRFRGKGGGREQGRHGHFVMMVPRPRRVFVFVVVIGLATDDNRKSSKPES